jgi:hypothetical protein
VKWFAQVQYSSNQQGRQLVPKEFRYQISNKFGYRATKERGAWLSLSHYRKRKDHSPPSYILADCH